MGLNFKKALGGVAALANPLTLGPAALGMLGSGSLYDKNTASQVPMETPEQRAARMKLMDFANTGRFGDFQAGAEIPLGYGDFTPTDQENQGLTLLQQLLSSGSPEMFDRGDSAIRDLLDTSPQALEAQFTPFNDILNRTMNESGDAFKRSAGFQGNLYSSATNKNLGDIQARGNESRAMELSRLTNSALDRKLSAVPLAFQSGQAREGVNMGRIQASQVYGGLTRRLNDERIKARDAELLRRRQELGMPIQAAQAVAGQNANFGVPSVTTNQPTELMEMLKLLVQGGSTFLGARAGA
jgi:hypothetical protein